MRKLLSILLGFIAVGCSDSSNTITFPFCQQVVCIKGTQDVSFKYDSAFVQNHSYIAPPVDEQKWEDWFSQISEYKSYVRENIGNNEVLFIEKNLPSGKSSKIHFDQISFELDILPKEKLVVDFVYRIPEGDFKLYSSYKFRKVSEYKSYADRRFDNHTDSLELSATNWVRASFVLEVPDFNPDSLKVAPSIDVVNVGEAKANIFFRNVTLSLPASSKRENVLADINNQVDLQKELDLQLYEQPEMDWMESNFVMGFAFMWDQLFYDPEKKEYTVQKYCDVMKKEFGGIQSVILWHSYPNIGIDERNQWDFFHYMPGGIKRIKEDVVDVFHENGIKVFITYNPWDLDTRRTDTTDFEYLAYIIGTCDMDGIFMDTWDRSEKLQDELDKYKKGVAVVPEIHPSFTKDIHGRYSCVGSWGQHPYPYDNQGVNHLKWLIPEHKNYIIARGDEDRQDQLLLLWINGNGIMFWENLFGRQNLWNAKDRKTMRVMNAIWKDYYKLYISDNWKPYMPTNKEQIVASSWEAEGQIIYNLISKTEEYKPTQVELEVEAYAYYYDIWTGKEVKPENGKLSILVDGFGCVLGTNEKTDDIQDLLAMQKKEMETPLPAVDEYLHLENTHEPIKFNYTANNDAKEFDLLTLNRGLMQDTIKHTWREGGCYPPKEASSPNELTFISENGKRLVYHVYEEEMPEYGIMPRVVTNAQFEEFLKASGYQPEVKFNFLKHWNGSNCPEDIKDEPVVFVSLEDVRAYAQWAGVRLPSEWEWLKAAKKYPEKFKYNEVYEWNESERNDGYNRFVMLVSGCERWEASTSGWYFGYGGGRQDVHNHCKYFLMNPSIDRASTIGFRCVKK